MRFGNLNPANLIGGAVFAGIGLLAIVEAASYPIGQLNRMGPGYLPIVLGVLLVGLGLGIIWQGRREPAPLPQISLRSVATISAAIASFGLAADHLGVVPATFAIVLLSSIAVGRFRAITALLTAIGLALFAYFVFIEALGVPIRAFRWG